MRAHLSLSGLLLSSTAIAFAGALTACGSVKPPPSVMPDAKTAVDRLDATYAQVSGIKGTAKIDYLGDKGRVRGDLLVLATAPASLRFGITANVIGGAGEVASDGIHFQAEDKANGKYLVGPAKPCNIARITQVPLPSDELVPMLWGMRPKIPGPIKCDSIEWDGDGFYKVMMSSADGKSMAHELRVAPTPDTWTKPYGEQKMRLLGVLGWSTDKGDADLVYRVTMKDHQLAHTAPPIVGDEPGLDEDVPPSGPQVDVDVPRSIKVEVPSKKSDVIFTYGDAAVNPPLPEGVFQLQLAPGVPVEQSECD
jgi:hypothetical protein